jgi:hypothetical protein
LGRSTKNKFSTYCVTSDINMKNRGCVTSVIKLIEWGLDKYDSYHKSLSADP